MSQVTKTVGRKCISTAINPFPWQASHRPPLTLKENRPGFQPRARDSVAAAKRSRMCVNAPVYVAGFERGVRPIGDWSMSTVRPRYSLPVNEAALYVCGVRYFRSRRERRLRWSISYIKVDFPEP